MPYSRFTLAKVKKEFGLTVIEGEKFIPHLEPIAPSAMLEQMLESYLPWAIAVGSEKAKSEALITPVLLELRRLLNNKISVFSGREFNVDSDLGLNGYCDYIISQSSEQLEIEAPVVVIVEARKENLNDGLGQCIATMLAAQHFNKVSSGTIPTIYEAVSSGTVWRFLQLSDHTITLELVNYPLTPVGNVLAILKWMTKENSG